jgi:hypothetical protein
MTKSVKQWLAEMKAAGFYGKYEARSGDLVIKGEIPRNLQIENAALLVAKLESAKLEKQKEMGESIVLHRGKAAKLRK